MIKTNPLSSQPINQQLIKQPAKPKLRLLNIELKDDINVQPVQTTYSEFTVNESGHYSISNQILFKALEITDVYIDTLQHGLCMLDQSDFAECFNSSPSGNVSGGSYISLNLASVKYLEANVKYILWFNVLLNSGKLLYIKQYSKLKLIKL